MSKLILGLLIVGSLAALTLAPRRVLPVELGGWGPREFCLTNSNIKVLEQYYGTTAPYGRWTLSKINDGKMWFKYQTADCERVIEWRWE